MEKELSLYNLQFMTGGDLKFSNTTSQGGFMGWLCKGNS